jgi:flavin-dependent dehydrogenase
MALTKYINASEAYKEAIRLGFPYSYPTLIKRLTRAKIGVRPFVRGVYVIDRAEFDKWIRKELTREGFL